MKLVKPLQQVRLRPFNCCVAALALVLLAGLIGAGKTPAAAEPAEQAVTMQSKCCSCGGAFPQEVARLCSSCATKYRSKCCLCNGAFPKDPARLCRSCSNRFRSKCFLCSGAFPKEIARICSGCTSKY